MRKWLKRYGAHLTGLLLGTCIRLYAATVIVDYAHGFAMRVFHGIIAAILLFAYAQEWTFAPWNDDEQS